MSEYDGVIKEVIRAYKFKHVKEAHRHLVDILEHTLPLFSDDTVIVPVPTVSKHVRVRGYDHTALLARGFAKRRGLAYNAALSRAHQRVQVGSDKPTRRKQANGAFECVSSLPDVPYVLIDDVVTTGATLEYASKSLRSAGAKTVWAAVIARQPLTKKIDD